MKGRAKGPTVPPGVPEATDQKKPGTRLKALRGETGKAVAGVLAKRLRGMKS